jgi:hypothetical protein
MKPLYKSIGLALLIGSCLDACSPVPYQTIGHNTPLLQGKNEVNLSASWTSGDNASGLGLQSAWAFDSSWALMSSFYSMKTITTWDEPEWKAKGRYFELGIGSFAKGKRAKGFVYEGFLGTGFTRIRNHYEQNKLHVNYMSIFVQGSLAYSVKWMELALTPRISYMHYTNKSYSFTDLEYKSRADNFFEKNNSKLLFEPGFTFRIGYKNIKLQMNYVASTFKAKGDMPEGEELQINDDFFSIGLNYVFTGRFKE